MQDITTPNRSRAARTFEYWGNTLVEACHRSGVISWTGLLVGAIISIVLSVAGAMIWHQSTNDVKRMSLWTIALFGLMAFVAITVETLRTIARKALDSEDKENAYIAATSKDKTAQEALNSSLKEEIHFLRQELSKRALDLRLTVVWTCSGTWAEGALNTGGCWLYMRMENLGAPAAVHSWEVGVTIDGNRTSALKFGIKGKQLIRLGVANGQYREFDRENFLPYLLNKPLETGGFREGLLGFVVDGVSKEDLMKIGNKFDISFIAVGGDWQTIEYLPGVDKVALPNDVPYTPGVER